jgi:hypothetical protein
MCQDEQNLYPTTVGALTLQLNSILEFLAAIEFSPFPEHYLLKNYRFFQKTSFLIVRNVIFNG